MRQGDKRLKVQCVFQGAAAMAIRELLRGGLDGTTIDLVVEGLALAELRRRIREAKP